MRKRVLIPLYALLLLSVRYAGAQSVETAAGDITSKIIRERVTSNQVLPKYTWTSRSEVVRKGKTLNILIEQNKIDLQGAETHKIINEKSASLPRSFLFHEIAEEEKESIEKFLFGLRDFLKNYTLCDNSRVEKFIASATWKINSSDHEFTFTGHDVEVAGDQLTWILQDQQYNTVRILVNTIFEGEPVTFSASFFTLPEGLNYLAFGEAQIPSKGITLLIQNYDYHVDSLPK